MNPPQYQVDHPTSVERKLELNMGCDDACFEEARHEEKQIQPFLVPCRTTGCREHADRIGQEQQVDLGSRPWRKTA